MLAGTAVAPPQLDEFFCANEADLRAAEFAQLKNAAEGVAKAEIVSAIALTDAQVGELKAVLEKRFGKKIEATVSVDPSVIGGARIVVGDQVVDGSIAGKLQAMATQLKS